jgi:hypothetical protein
MSCLIFKYAENNIPGDLPNLFPGDIAEDTAAWPAGSAGGSGNLRVDLMVREYPPPGE